MYKKHKTTAQLKQGKTNVKKTAVLSFKTTEKVSSELKDLVSKINKNICIKVSTASFLELLIISALKQGHEEMLKIIKNE
jgi:hypothetical protein